jgi:hypothetical protein
MKLAVSILGSTQSLADAIGTLESAVAVLKRRQDNTECLLDVARAVTLAADTVYDVAVRRVYDAKL